MMDGACFVMDDTDSCAREEVAAFEDTLSPELRVEIEAKIKAVNDSFDARRERTVA